MAVARTVKIFTYRTMMELIPRCVGGKMRTNDIVELSRCLTLDMLANVPLCSRAAVRAISTVSAVARVALVNKAASNK